jgi:hypothetical protein
VTGISVNQAELQSKYKVNLASSVQMDKLKRIKAKDSLESHKNKDHQVQARREFYRSGSQKLKVPSDRLARCTSPLKLSDRLLQQESHDKTYNPYAVKNKPAFTQITSDSQVKDQMP